MSCATCTLSGREKAAECPGCEERFAPDGKVVVVNSVEDYDCKCGYEDPANADICPACGGKRAPVEAA